MQGLDEARTSVSPQARERINAVLNEAYGGNLFDESQLEDVILFTNRRIEFANIGTDVIAMKKMAYLTDNIFWINVCLFINDDFRACFEDAITIEKALLQVNDQEYQDFRDDMILDSDEGEPDKLIGIDFSGYSETIADVISNRVKQGKKSFVHAGMGEVYNDLASDFDAKGERDTRHVINNLIYVINAFSRNGVFRKYVTLVVDSVKKQLS